MSYSILSRFQPCRRYDIASLTPRRGVDAGDYVASWHDASLALFSTPAERMTSMLRMVGGMVSRLCRPSASHGMLLLACRDTAIIFIVMASCLKLSARRMNIIYGGALSLKRWFIERSFITVIIGMARRHHRYGLLVPWRISAISSRRRISRLSSYN